MRRAIPRSAQLVAAGTVTLSLLAICCGWPYEVRNDVPSDVTDSAVDTLVVDTAPYDVPSATCNDGGLRSGEAIACACDPDASVDAGPDGETGPLGYQTCTLEGGVGSCVGCPVATTCEGVTAPVGTTCIPGGVTVLGAKNANVCPPEGCAVEGPEHSVAVSRFFLDEREVTVKRFRDWWRNGHVAPKPGDEIYAAGDGISVVWQESWVVSEPVVSDGSNAATWLGGENDGNDALPINHVDWPTALAFCVANGARLPTEAEWETAASARAGRLFPREAPDTRNEAPIAAMLPCTRAISAASGADCGPPAPPSGSNERFSIDGAYDLAGSLAEWVLDVPPPGSAACTVNCYPSAPSVDPLLFVSEVTQRGVRGGAWNDTEPSKLRAQARDFRELTTKASSIGFRCAR